MGYIKRVAMESILSSGRTLDNCEKCDKPLITPQIHHKDTNRNNNEPNNLMVLCRSCHMLEEYKIKHHKLKCKECGKIFYHNHSTVKWCSRKCYNDSYYKRTKEV